jgi:hypothetical protein
MKRNVISRRRRCKDFMLFNLRTDIGEKSDLAALRTGQAGGVEGAARSQIRSPCSPAASFFRPPDKVSARFAFASLQAGETVASLADCRAEGKAGDPALHGRRGEPHRPL